MEEAVKYIESCIIAFSMYSKIPMPQREWEAEAMKYAMCFFPWVGAAAGGIFYLWGIYGKQIPVGPQLYAAILTVIPILITGGIHMDGFLDTMDALSSWQSRERRLEILKDAHAGAFAVTGAGVYFLLYFGFASELEPAQISAAAFGFFLSRCLSGFAVTSFPCAKESGLAALFARAADRRKARTILFLESILAMTGLLWLNIYAGGAVIAASILAFLWYYRMSVEKFGGITGDLAGWFVQVCELLQLAAICFSSKVFG
ncbi:MAG: adenosylcobinamide-GDP ribazoletransferase [Lachnospiraceae bacterium]|nr:adenosylcobinamide-GDP ribazoletransferase [Lachnospiraceae bacterium]